MKFLLPDEPADIVADLMAAANLKTAEVAALKDLCHRAGVEIDAWRGIAQQIIDDLAALEAVRLSAMATDRLVIEQQQRVVAALARACESLRTQLATPQAVKPSDQVAA